MISGSISLEDKFKFLLLMHEVNAAAVTMGFGLDGCAKLEAAIDAFTLDANQPDFPIPVFAVYDPDSYHQFFMTRMADKPVEGNDNQPSKEQPMANMTLDLKLSEEQIAELKASIRLVVYEECAKLADDMAAEQCSQAMTGPMALRLIATALRASVA